MSAEFRNKKEFLNFHVLSMFYSHSRLRSLLLCYIFACWQCFNVFLKNHFYHFIISLISQFDGKCWVRTYRAHRPNRSELSVVFSKSWVTLPKYMLESFRKNPPPPPTEGTLLRAHIPNADNRHHK